ncbi:MAG: hypothetical protein AAFU60_08935 [Bacteroidota bacterium]
MKNLSEKFDQLPQDFDREAIWQGIEKPTGFFYIRTYLWKALGLIGAGSAILGSLLFYAGFFAAPSSSQDLSKSQLNTSKPSTKIAASSATTNPRLSIPSIELEDSKKTDRTLISPQVNKLDQIRTENHHTNTKSSTTPKPSKTEATPPAPVQTILQETKSIYKQENLISTTVDTPQPVEREPSQVLAMSLTEQASSRTTVQTFALAPPLPTPTAKSDTVYYLSSETSLSKLSRNQSITHSLAVRMGVGSHQSQFSAPGEEDLTLRSGLERTQLDYHLGLRYALQVNNGFFLALSGNYHLYKEEINTSFLKVSTEEDILVSYRLYNHYHQFSGQAGIGKRFQQKFFFIDLQAGMGLTMHQAVDADYFLAEGQLASPTEVQTTYMNTNKLFFNGEAAIGKYIGDRWMLRMGPQFNGPIQLTGPTANSNHRLSSYLLFVEFGTWF